jgi:pimeloyl-ACP methyl ester carboxylesterase
MLASSPYLIPFEARAPWEFGAAMATMAAMPLLKSVADGDGHSVVIYPGLISSDVNTLPLRMFLAECGYDVHGWDEQVNMGPCASTMGRSIERVKRLRKKTGRKVSLVGWSLGGLYAREIAREVAKDIRCVITLGTPFVGGSASREPPPVPTTSLYSRTDGVVDWQLSIHEPGADRENIEIDASHNGMGMHPAAWFAIADRLAQPEGAWKKLHRTG